MILYNWNPVSKEPVIQKDKNSIFAFSKPWSKVWTYYEKKLQVRTMNAEGRQIIVFFSISRLILYNENPVIQVPIIQIVRNLVFARIKLVNTTYYPYYGCRGKPYIIRTILVTIEITNIYQR